MSRSPWMGASDEFPTLALSRPRQRLFSTGCYAAADKDPQDPFLIGNRAFLKS